MNKTVTFTPLYRQSMTVFKGFKALALGSALGLMVTLPAAAYARAPEVSTGGEEQIKAQDELAKEQWAYSVGIQAYVFGLPLLIFDREQRLRLDATRLERVKHLCPCAPVNSIGHMSKLATAHDQLPYTPNNDTVYSGGLLDLEQEPVVLTLPDITHRYWSLQVANAYLENVLYLGSRASDGEGGNHVFVGPHWQGELPKDLIVHRMKSNRAVLALRIGVEQEKPNDLERVTELQHQVFTTSLSNWGKASLFGKTNAPQKTLKTYGGELAFYERFADLMIDNPPEAKHAAALAPFKHIGIIPGLPFEVDELDAATRRGMARALMDGKNIMRWKVKYRGTPYNNGWNNLHEGRYGFNYINRAEGALEGLLVHNREEAVYFSTYEDSAGKLFDANHRYVLHFDKDQIPPVIGNGFWSITMYGPDFQLVKNPIERYSIGDRTDTLKYNEDGSLDIYIQNTPPEGREGNWLPSPEVGLFRLNYRIYRPEVEAQTPGTLTQFLPGVKRLD